MSLVGRWRERGSRCGGQRLLVEREFAYTAWAEKFGASFMSMKGDWLTVFVERRQGD